VPPTAPGRCYELTWYERPVSEFTPLTAQLAKTVMLPFGSTDLDGALADVVAVGVADGGGAVP
jgi:hypothetical protein